MKDGRRKASYAESTSERHLLDGDDSDVGAVDAYPEDDVCFSPVRSAGSTPRIPHADTSDQTKSRICRSSGPMKDDDSPSELVFGQRTQSKLTRRAGIGNTDTMFRVFFRSE